MKRSITIMALILIYLLTCSKSCNSREEERMAREQQTILHARDSIVSGFATDSLSALDKAAFAVSSQSKLADLISCMNILADSATAGAFRERTLKMARSIVTNDNCTFTLVDPADGKTIKSTLSELPFVLASFPKGTPIRRPDSVWFSTVLSRDNDTTFSGALSYAYLPSRDKNQSVLWLKGNSIRFSILKIPKQFGDTTIRVWTVKMEGNFGAGD